MCGKEWFENITINKSKPSIAQQILLYLFTHRSVDRPEDIPQDDSRTTSTITGKAGGSPAGVVKALNNLSNAKEGGEKAIVPVIKIRPKHGKGRQPGSPPQYYSLTRYGESEALALVDDLEFDINMRRDGSIHTQRGNYDSLIGVCTQLEHVGMKIDVSDKKEVVRHLIQHGHYNMETGAEAHLIKILSVDPRELPYPVNVVGKVAGDLKLLSEVIKGMISEMVGIDNFEVQRVGDNEYRGQVKTIGEQHGLLVKRVIPDESSLVRYRYEANYMGNTYSGWVDISLWEGDTGTGLSVRTFADDPWDAADIRSMSLIIDIMEKMALEVLRRGCQKSVEQCSN